MTGNFLPVPIAEPTDAPLLRVCFNLEYLPMILNAIEDMNRWYVFDSSPETAIDEQVKIDKLTDIFMNACDYAPKGRKMTIGTVIAHVGTDTPEGFLVCDGSSYFEDEYPELYAIIDSEFKGIEGGLNYFNVPDLRARSIVGVSVSSLTDRTPKAIGTTGGKETHALSEIELPELSPRVSAVQDAANTVVPGNTRRFAQPSATLIYSTNHTIPTLLDSRVSFGGGGAHDNKSPFIALNYIICATSEECC